MTVPDCLFHILKINAPPAGEAFTKRQRCAGGRVDLVPVMHLQNFDIVFDAQQFRSLFRQRDQKSHADTGIRGAHNRHMPRRLFIFGFLRRRETGCTRDDGRTRLRRQLGGLNCDIG